MKSKTTILILLPVLAICVLANPSRAQEGEIGPVVISKPAQTKPPKLRKADFEVMNMTRTGIQVRSVTNTYDVHTFSYAEPIRVRMKNMFDQDAGYRYGDKVKIVYQPGSEVALKIKGKPSKPS
jgi:hypothetical protein